jgi:putative transposase
MPAKAPIAVDDGYRISDELWARIEPLLPPLPPHPRGGRPWTDSRSAMDGVHFLLRTGCQWQAMPRCFGASSTIHDRFQRWRAAGVFRKLWRAGLIEYDLAEGIDWEWQAMDGAMTKAPLGGGKHRPEPHRPRQRRRQALAPDRG